jgi:hypothetical protein
MSKAIISKSLSLPVTAAGPNAVSDTIDLSDGDWGSAILQIEPAFVGAYAIEGSLDGQNWEDVSKFWYFGSAGAPASITAPGIWYSTTGLTYKFRFRCTSYTSGSPTVTVKWQVSNPGPGYLT